LKKLDPKTFYLYNEPPPPEEPATEPEEKPKQYTDAEREMIGKETPEAAYDRAMRHRYMRQFSDLRHMLMDPNVRPEDVHQAIDDMIRSSAIRYDPNEDNGIGFGVKLGPTMRGILNETIGMWNDARMDREAGALGLDPVEYAKKQLEEATIGRRIDDAYNAQVQGAEETHDEPAYGTDDWYERIERQRQGFQNMTSTTMAPRGE